PHTSDTLIIGYTGQELADCYANEERIWRYFVQENLFFETSFERKRKFVEESPRVLEIGDNCPGRIGRWLGWQIIKSFQQKHPTLTLDSLLKIKDANLIFQASKYKPKS
ncbi:MAG: gliding motility lipoprotein GldB, partial [Flammeovirgaceae bacterium]|nr:gliding motility lipoprotein GldB [Flammeovirgaceae bacterium]MDW8287708.1 gliding motility lipoprotein GldB [Flammeovirgaceae bacterium]